MIKYIVLKYAHNASDEWAEILGTDFSEILDAETFRTAYLDRYPSVDPLNVHVIQAKE